MFEAPAVTELTHSRFLDLPALAALEGLRFAAKQRIEGTYTGRHVSRRIGGGGEFVDFREYSPGEDLRRLDWKVFARTGKAYVRLHQDETNLPCVLAMDVSQSMRLGEGQTKSPGLSKLEYAQYLSTALSHVIAGGQDQVGLAVLADELRDYVPPGGAATHVAHLHQLIERLETQPTTRMADAVRQLFSRVRARGVLLFLTDFLFDDLLEFFQAIRLFRSRQFEVILLHLVHPEEEQLPETGVYRFEGLEGEGRVDCATAEIRDEYARNFAAHLAKIRAHALAGGCDYRLVSLREPYLRVLGGFLVERSG